MAKTNKFSKEVRERAVRMLFEQVGDVDHLAVGGKRLIVSASQAGGTTKSRSPSYF
ncbi:hypothetical protein KJ059_03865 [Myxococcota bacterium]|nr:hypothetical protein [Myxococcota bacterium]MCZ7619288.1 hypothetical protein [Myxococcota bacterium]